MRVCVCFKRPMTFTLYSMTGGMPQRKTDVTVTLIPTLKRSVPLFLPMGLDEIFHEESRFRTKKGGDGGCEGVKGEETPVSAIFFWKRTGD